MKNSFCIIPVRGGSKGLPRKNLLKIYENFSLLEWTIDQAKKVYEFEGYHKKKIKVIANGYDLSLLKTNKIQKKNF